MKLNRPRLILGLYVLALIVITELVAGHLELPAWPAFVAWVLFFGEHTSPKRAPHYYTFMFFTVAGLALAAPNPNPPLWLLMEVAGGGLLIGATILVGRTIAAPSTAEAAH